MSAVDAPSSCSYELDEEMRIVLVDPAWGTFAMENGAPELVPPAPLGRTLWSYISDPTTAQLWYQLLEKVRRTGASLVLQIRCDSATLKRYLDLRVSPRPFSGVRIETTIVRLESRVPVPLLDRDRQSSGGMLRMCSWCKRVMLCDRWVDVEEATASLRLFERTTLPEITHGMCPDCHTEVSALLADDR